MSGLGFRVSGFVFRVSGLGLRVSGFGFRVSCFVFRVSGLVFRVSCFVSRVSGLGFRILRVRGYRLGCTGIKFCFRGFALRFGCVSKAWEARVATRWRLDFFEMLFLAGNLICF